MRVSECSVVQDFSIQVVQSCKEGDDAMARVVMRGGSHMPNANRQNRLSSLKGLALAFFVEQSTSAFSGGFKNRLMTAQKFSSNRRSLEILKVRVR